MLGTASRPQWVYFQKGLIFMGTVLVLAVLLAVVGLIIRGMVKDRRQGKSSCGGDCASCHGGCSHKC